MRIKKGIIPTLFVTCLVALSGAILTSKTFVKADDLIIRDPTEDTTPPFLVLSEELNVEELPVGQVNEFYPFWKVSGYDAKGEYLKNISNLIVCSVYYGDEKLDGVHIENGGFVPTKTGEYTVVYSLEDEAGNEATSLQGTFEVKAFMQPIELMLENEFLDTYYVGQTLTIPAYTAEGGSGNLSVEVSVQNYGNGIFEILDGTTYFFEKAGKYSVVYTISDYLGVTQYFRYYFNVEYSKGPIIEDTVYPVAITANKKFYYNVPKAYDYSYSGSATEVPVRVEIAENDVNGDYKTPEGKYYQPSANVNSIFVRYISSTVLSEDNKTVTKPMEIPVVKPQTIADYFYTISGSIDKSFATTGIKELYFSPVDGSAMQFINAVDVSAFKTNLLFDTKTINYEKVSFTLTDSIDPLQKLSVTIEKSSETNIDVMAGGNRFVVNGLPDGQSKIALVISDTMLTVNGTDIVLSKFDTGKAFTGFSSHKAYITFNFDDVASETALRITEFINMNSLFSSTALDNWQPTLTLNGQAPTTCDVYDYVELPAAMVFDTIDTDCSSVILTFRDPDGNVILDGVDATKVNRVRLEKSGQYIGYYVAYDETGNRARLPVSVYARDVIAPKIEIDGQIKTTAKLGEKLNIPAYYAYDNLTEDLTPYVFLITPTFGIKTVSKDGINQEYTFVKTGVYTLQFFVFDSDYNETVLEFTITVTE